MRLVTGFLRLAFKTHGVRQSLTHYVPVRNCNITKVNPLISWVRPERLPAFHPKNSGDLDHIKFPPDELIVPSFASCELLRSCENESVLKIFRMKNQCRWKKFDVYREELKASVKSHKFDETSRAVRIASMTAKIRFLQHLYQLNPNYAARRYKLNTIIQIRKKHLNKLRSSDYKQYEWLLDKLNIVFKANPLISEKVTRKKSIRLLAQLRTEKLKEQKIAEFKEKLDDLKVPFLKEKIEKLKWIKEKETALQLEPTVTDQDIENCVKEMEKVNLEVQERKKKGYMRKIHPYTLEPYEPTAAELVKS